MAIRSHTKVPATFGIPDEILAPSSKCHPANITVLKLSAETLSSIYRNIRRPADQVKFALCSKTFARVAKAAKLNTAIILSPKKPKIRAYSVTDLKGELTSWPQRRECKACKTGLTERRIWLNQDGIEITKLKRVDWMWAVKDWMGGGKLCPPCRIAEHYHGAPGWLQSRPEGFARVTMFHHAEERI